MKYSRTKISISDPIIKMKNLDAHFSCQDASLVLQCFYGLHVCGQYIACYYTEHIHSRCVVPQGHIWHRHNRRQFEGFKPPIWSVFDIWMGLPQSEFELAPIPSYTEDVKLFLALGPVTPTKYVFSIIVSYILTTYMQPIETLQDQTCILTAEMCI